MKHIFQTKLLLLLCMLTCAGVGWAETLTVANGTATSSYAPIYGNWADAYLKCEIFQVRLLQHGLERSRCLSKKCPTLLSALSRVPTEQLLFMKELSMAQAQR